MKTAAPIDTSVRIPAAVLRQTAAAEAAQRRFVGQDDPQPQPDPAPTPDPQPQPDPAPTPDPQPQPDPAPASQPEIIPPAAQPVATDDWKQKYERSQGRVVALERAQQDYRDRIDNLERVIATMQMAPQPTPAPVSDERYITDDDINTYGADFFDAVERKAKEMIAPLKAELEGKLTQLGTQVGGVAKVVEKDARAIMEDRITRDVPNWLELNVDPEFISWCKEEDPLTGQERLVMLHQAWGRNDGPRVANFFKTFLREKAAVAPDEPPADSDRPAAPTVSLGAFAAPGKARQASAPKDAPAKSPVTRQSIAQFYADVSAGKYRNNEARRLEIERDIFDAQREGRIT